MARIDLSGRRQGSQPRTRRANPPPAIQRLKSRTRPPQGAPVPPKGYLNEFLQNAIDLHKVQGVTPVAYTRTPWRGQYPTPSIDISAFPRYRWKGAPAAETYSPPLPTASGDFISDWRNNVPQDNQGLRVGVGPGGEQLPNGAIGWDNNGNPYYGDGIKGAFSEFYHKIREEPEEVKPPSVYMGGETPLEIAGSVVGTVFNNYGNLLNWAKQFRPVRFANEAIKLGLKGIQEPAIKTEQAYSTGRGLEEAGEGSFLPDITPEIPLIGGKDFSFLVYANPVALAYNALRVVTSPKPRDEQWRNITDAYQAGRVLYSGAWDPMVREEYIRRYQAGENPYLLARELENPWAEMVGQSIYDPFNILDFVGFGKARQASKLVSKLDDFAKISPDIKRVIEMGANVANDAEGIQVLNKAVDAIQANKVRRLASIEKLAGAHGISSLTARGKAFVTAQRAGEFINNAVLFASRTSDEALDLLEGMYRLASDDVDEIAQGLNTVKKAPSPNMFFSDAGVDAGIVLRQMIEDSPKNFLAALKKAKVDAKTPEEAIRLVAEEAGRRLDGATAKMFPTLTQRVKAVEEGVERLGLVDIKKLPWTTRSLVAFDNAAQKMLFKPWNTFFSTVYMGTSPSYAFRNLFNNVFTAMIDEGIGAAFGNKTRNLAEMRQWFGGAVPKGAELGIQAGTKGVEQMQVPKAFRFATDLAGKFEQWTSINVAAAATRRLMRKMLVPGRAIPDMRPLIDAGMSQEMANALWKLVVKNKGNIRQSVDEFAKMAKGGAVDAITTGHWIPEALRTPAEEFGILDEVQKIASATGKTLDEKIADMRALLKKTLDDAVKRVNGEARGVDLLVTDPVTGIERAPEGLDVIEALGGAHNADDIAADIIQPATDYINANHNAISAFREALSQWADEVGPLLPPEVQRDIYKILGDNPEYLETRKFHQTRVDVTTTMRDWSLGRKEPPPWWSLDEAWKRLNMPGKAPTDPKEFRRRLWGEYYFPPVREAWNKYRDWLANAVEELIARQPGSDPRLLEQARRQHAIAQAYDLMLRNDEVGPQLAQAVRAGDNALYARVKAHQYGIATSLASPDQAGANLDRMLLNIINANLPEGVQRFTRLEDVPFSVADSAIPAHFVKRAPGVTPPVTEVARTATTTPPTTVTQISQSDFIRDLLNTTTDEQVAKIMSEGLGTGIKDILPAVPPAATSSMPSDARVIVEQMEGIQDMFNQFEDALRANHGRLIPSNWSKEVQNALESWTKVAEGRMAEARYLVAEAANEARKFTLHNYAEKMGFDLALSYIYPYHFWYSRTFKNWLKRIVQHPAVIADYARYREAMAKIHAGAPEWWKYNINSNDIPGIETDNPLFFNLEATLNPLNGLTGVDFNDNDKRINWWTETIDNLSKYGPTVWAPYQYATALALKLQGEEDAAARWGGRLIPQTLNLKNLLTLMNVNIPTGKGINETDLAVHFFSGGQDPYEAKRVGRALGLLVDQGLIDQATALEAARTQEGPVWQMATEEAIRQRAGSPALAITNFMLGVGFKARTTTDLQIDRMDQEWRFLWGQRPNLSPDVFQQKMDALREKYPFMETVLLSRKSGNERDEAYAWNVLSRIPPGQKDDAAALVGLSGDKISQFYESKGAILETWKQPDRDKFMASIVELGAILDLPDSATRQEWNAAKELYNDVDGAIERQWGKDTLDRIDLYYAFKDDYTARDNYLAQHPDVQEALEYRDYMEQNNPLLRKYYSSFDEIERYYRSLMYDGIREKLGENISETWDMYYELQLTDSKEAKKFYDAHPELKQYSLMKNDYQKRIAEVLTELAKRVKEPVYQFREDVTPETEGEMNLVEGLRGEGEPTAYDLTAQDFEEMMSPTLWRLTLDHVLAGEDLSRAAEDQLEYIASDLNITSEQLLALIEDSLR